MDELLGILFAAAIQFSGLPAMDERPLVRALPYQAMLREVCADLKEEIPSLQARYNECRRLHSMQPSSCDALKFEADKYPRCLHQHGLVAAYIIEQDRIVYRDDLDLNDDTDNSFLVHEFVHALQIHHFGAQVFDTCQGTLFLERQAYGAQQKYLKARGQMLRVGDRLRYVNCNGFI